ncbi:WYL domain-containing protein [Nonomuraea angiospora]|uniref:WYL domain-containing protein n=1 Tax=Nonomuraea angiospora TaxID=46172 RepID=UPI0029A812EA|nr:WYL domain-containing protein [Nonomuraea angiospora]MDX3110150.1 WYL domain-containing protein [Nonomuraea angiospora]
MYEIGTQVRYHGSIVSLHGQTLTVVGHCHGGERHVLVGDAGTVRHARTASLTPLDAPDPCAELEQAIAAEQPVIITYVDADGEWTTRTIEPYELFRTRYGDLIVRAMDRLRGEPRSFRLDRIEALRPFPGVRVLDQPAPSERAALARIRAEIREIAPSGYGNDQARWIPGDPIL